MELINHIRERKRLMIVALAICICGYALLFWVSWKVALGTFLVHWSILIEFKAREK